MAIEFSCATSVVNMVSPVITCTKDKQCAVILILKAENLKARDHLETEERNY
jgi:hypothetical protein